MAAEITLTPASRVLLRDLWEDAPNWSGTPPTDGNVGMSKEERGNLTQLKRAGLLSTFRWEGMTWVAFTDEGREYAASIPPRETNPNACPTHPNAIFCCGGAYLREGAR